ncbi:thioesterase family protein [Kribbella sp. NPDC050459]|uniref:thioesterase family protein n=1 Tax=Kribbella sp. NPDC050459 TaxID=3155785 RepID=UPI00340CBAFF
MLVDETVSADTFRPRYGSANIRTWIGFKQFVSIAEEAVLTWFRDRGRGPQELYESHGLALSVLDSSVLLPSVLTIDDTVEAQVESRGAGDFRVRLTTERKTGPETVLKGRVRVGLVDETGEGQRPPGDLAAAVDVVPGLPPATTTVDADAFRHDWTARYFHCQYSSRVQHSAYVAHLEELVDRYLAGVGLAIPELLETRGWIPVVSRARVTLVGQACMGDVIASRFAVTDVWKDKAYDGRMTCEVGGTPVAQASIVHGYAVSRGSEAGQLATLDADTLHRLTRADR